MIERSEFVHETPITTSNWTGGHAASEFVLGEEPYRISQVSLLLPDDLTSTELTGDITFQLFPDGWTRRRGGGANTDLTSQTLHLLLHT